MILSLMENVYGRGCSCRRMWEGWLHGARGREKRSERCGMTTRNIIHKKNKGFSHTLVGIRWFYSLTPWENKNFIMESFPFYSFFHLLTLFSSLSQHWQLQMMLIPVSATVPIA